MTGVTSDEPDEYGNPVGLAYCAAARAGGGVNTLRLELGAAVAKRESQLLGVLTSTTGLYGDLQGIAGQALPEIEIVEAPLLSAPPGE